MKKILFLLILLVMTLTSCAQGVEEFSSEMLMSSAGGKIDLPQVTDKQLVFLALSQVSSKSLKDNEGVWQVIHINSYEYVVMWYNEKYFTSYMTEVSICRTLSEVKSLLKMQMYYDILDEDIR